MWEQIRANRRRSALLITGMATVLLLLGYFSGEALGGPGRGIFGLGLALTIWGVLMLVYLTSAESILLQSAGAHPLQREDSPRLFNIVDEMVLASGLGTTPKLYLVDDPAPNAFAVGRKPDTFAIAVTAGLLQRLDRDELQGVIAHEMSHLKNQDVRFMTLAAILLGSIVMLADIVSRTIRFGGRGRRRDDSRDGGGSQAQAIIFVLALVFAILGPVMAQLLYFACSRKREFLADASAAQFTRYPEGLASALEKIAGAQLQEASASRATAPLFIVNPLYAGGTEPSSVFASHPSTAERIRILRGMAGAGLADYEAAYRRARAGDLIGKQSLQAAAPQSIRPPSTDDPAESRRAMRDVVSRAQGYLRVRCQCGLEMSVPEGYERPELRCLRCGSAIPLPTAQELAGVPLAPDDADDGRARPPGLRRAEACPVIRGEASATQAGDPVPATPGESPLLYQRTGTGWESFRCRCGRTVQLSPAFNATILRCQGCGRQIQVTQR